MTTTKVSDQIQELAAAQPTPEKKIEVLLFRLEELEDRSGTEARKIRKQIRAIKDQAGIDRTRLTPTGRTPTPPAIQPEPDPETITEILTKYRKMTAAVQAARRGPIDSGLPTPNEVIARARQTAGVDGPDTTKAHSPACRKCHTIPDPDTPCRKCHTPLCNCSRGPSSDGLCKKCRKETPRIENSTRNLGKFGNRNI